jgi:hypothetical protein
MAFFLGFACCAVLVSRKLLLKKQSGKPTTAIESVISGVEQIVVGKS